MLGIRPEDVFVTPGEVSEGGITSSVNLVEFIGADTYIHSTLNQECKIISRIAPDVDLRIGDPISIDFKREKILLFDPESGERII